MWVKRPGKSGWQRWGRGEDLCGDKQKALFLFFPYYLLLSFYTFFLIYLIYFIYFWI
jgi:hypothetical protein